MTSTRTVIPVYTTKGECRAYLVYPHLFNSYGEWIGWVTPERHVYSVHGQYVGWLSNDPRILRKRAADFSRSSRIPPQEPDRLFTPAHVPLAPLMPELRFDTVDVLDEFPDLLPTVDFGEDRLDLD